MNARVHVGAVLFAVIASATTVSGAALAQDEVFRNPRIDGMVLDGCYSWPGDCDSASQAEAFCQEMGFDGAFDWDTENRAGAFTARRLGDGGTCFASCTVMTYVECE